MGKVNVLILNSDNTGTFKKCKTKGNKVLISKKDKPEFVEGKSIFPVKIKYLWGLIKRTKRFIIWVNGATTCLQLDQDLTKIMGTSWTMEELKDYIAKLVHLSLVKEKPFSNLQVYIFWILIGFNLLLTLLLVRRIGI